VIADPIAAARPSRRELVGLVAVVAAGAALRVIGLGQGIPYSIGWDEPQIVDRAVHIIQTGDFNPHFFDYPAFYIYVQACVAAVRFLVGAARGLWSDLGSVQASDFYLWARIVAATLGTATIVLTWAVARRLGRFAGFTAALLLATQSLHVRESHYALTDVPMTFLVALTILLTVRASERPAAGTLFWAGVTAGLAAATKYNGGIVLILPVIAVVLTGCGRRSRMAGAGLVAGGAAVAFLLTAPYTVLDLPDFLNAFAKLVYMYSAGAPPAEPPWLTYVKHLRLSLGWSGLVVVAAALVVAVARAVRTRGGERMAWIAAVLFPVVWFVVIARQQIVWGRYLLPLLPSLAIATGGALGWLATALRRVDASRLRRSAVLVVLLALAAGPQTVTAVEFDRLLSRVSTNAQAYAWILAHIPAGSKIAIETRFLLLPAAYPSEIETQLVAHDYDYYATHGFDVVIAVSAAFGNAVYGHGGPAGERTAYENLFRRLAPVQTFVPTSTHPGPEIRIYRVVR
jgi:4-amino-4-deoxy-L-arabinose transferase-like glycosyltransferase